MADWTGIIAYLDRTTADGRKLVAPRELETGRFPLPLIADSDRGEPLGTVDRVFIEGQALRAEGTVRDGALAPGQEVPAGVDVDRIVWDSVRDGVANEWRLRAVHVYFGKDHEPAWPGTFVRLTA